MPSCLALSNVPCPMTGMADSLTDAVASGRNSSYFFSRDRKRRPEAGSLPDDRPGRPSKPMDFGQYISPYQLNVIEYLVL